MNESSHTADIYSKPQKQFSSCFILSNAEFPLRSFPNYSHI